ncbi:unnamed protein product [Leuciscus chuanchicus]
MWSLCSASKALFSSSGIRHQCGLPLLSSFVFLSFNPSSWGSVAPKDPALHPARLSIAITQDGAGVQLSQSGRGKESKRKMFLKAHDTGIEGTVRMPADSQSAISLPATSGSHISLSRHIERSSMKCDESDYSAHHGL